MEHANRSIRVRPAAARIHPAASRRRVFARASRGLNGIALGTACWLLLPGASLAVSTSAAQSARSAPSTPASGSTATESSQDPWSWRTLKGPVSDVLAAVAVDRSETTLALGDSEGLAFASIARDPAAPLDSGWRRVRLPGAVVDLAFAADATVWAATARGLWRVDPAGQSSELALAPGDGARRVHRVLLTGRSVLAATDAGLFVSNDARVWTRVVDGLPQSPVVAIAARAVSADRSGTDSFDVFAIADGRLWRLRLDAEAGAVAVGSARRVEIAGQPANQPPVDVVVDFAGDEVVVLFSQAIARTLETGSDPLRWEVVFPVLAPGSIALRLFDAGGAVWLATDQGLMAAAPWPTRWQRAKSPAGHGSTVALAGTADTLFAVGPSRVLVGQRSPGGGNSLGPEASLRLSADPDLRRVHAKVLERAGLEPEYFEKLRRRIGRRGWVPAISLRAGAVYDVDTQGDYDESFTYGQLQQLNDRFNGRSSGIDGSVTFIWDLADVVYNSDAPDLSREARQVVTLRDNVLDEVNQLYFDRRRSLAALARFEDRNDPEALALEIRCQELAAGLDAWTGGWFSEAIEARP